MQNDEIIWRVIGKTFCSFKTGTDKDTFCKHPHNVTNICSRVTCPLANSLYATVVEQEGLCYLYLKTPERAHTPKYIWEKVLLPKNYKEALTEIEMRMQNVYKAHQTFRCKQRLTRIRQTLIRTREQRTKPQVRLVPVQKKLERRELAREAKAEKAAKLENVIESELLSRLHKGLYQDLYERTTAVVTVPEADIVDMAVDRRKQAEIAGDVKYYESEMAEDASTEDEMEDYSTEMLDEDIEELGERGVLMSKGLDDEFDDDDDMEDLTDVEDVSVESDKEVEIPRMAGSKRRNERRVVDPVIERKKKRGPRLMIEYEEDEPAQVHSETA